MECYNVFDIICLERRIDFGGLVISILGILGLISIYLAYRQFRFAERAHRTEMYMRLCGDILEDEERREFIYRLDYSAWKFDPNSFPVSEEEKHIDILLYRLSLIGQLLRTKDLSLDNLEWLSSYVRVILRNPEIHKYRDG